MSITIKVTISANEIDAAWTEAQGEHGLGFITLPVPSRRVWDALDAQGVGDIILETPDAAYLGEVIDFDLHRGRTGEMYVELH